MKYNRRPQWTSSWHWENWISKISLNSPDRSLKGYSLQLPSLRLNHEGKVYIKNVLNHYLNYHWRLCQNHTSNYHQPWIPNVANVAGIYFLIQMYISIFILSLFKLIEDGRKGIVSCAEHILDFFVFHSSPLVLLPRISLTRTALESPALSYLPLLLVCFTSIFSWFIFSNLCITLY